MKLLQENEFYYRTLLNSVSDVIVEITEDGKQKFVSPVVEKYTGYTAEELKRPFSEVIHPDDLNVVISVWKQCLYDFTKSYKVEYRHIHKTKGYVWVEANARSFINVPEINSVIISVRDISERKETEEALALSREHYKALSASATEMLRLDSLEYIYTYTNKTLNEYFRGTVTAFVTVDEDYYNAELIDIQGVNDTVISDIFRLTGNPLKKSTYKLLPGHYQKYKTGKLANFEGGLADFAGSEFPSIAAKKIQKMLGIKDIYAIGINKDNKLYAVQHFFTTTNSYKLDEYFIESFIKQAGIVIERQIMQNKLRDNEFSLRNLNDTKDKLFSVIGHDLRNPLNNIIGFSKLMLDNNYSQNEITDFSQHIYNSSQGMAQLLENLLQWSRTQQEGLTFNKSKLKVNELAVSCIQLVSTMAASKKIKIQNRIPDNLFAWGNKQMITTVIRNLLSNAIKFTNPGGEVQLKGEKKNASCIVSIVDTGVGITNTEDLFRLNDVKTTKGTSGESGTGLGLIICKEFIEKNNGNIWVDSTPGKGSAFFFSLKAK